MDEVELLFTSILKCNRAGLYQNRDLILDKTKSSLIANALKRRIKREPLAYILGSVEFMGLEFKVTPDVLIPRPETEILVEKTIELVRSQKSPPRDLAGPPRFVAEKVRSMLEIGTGSGCIAVSLAKLLSDVEITATDISLKALKIAQENAKVHSVTEKINFFCSDLFSTSDLELMTFDFILSNPPYILANDIKNLQPELQYEPNIALNGGKDGLDFYRKIINQAPNYLKDGGLLIMEMGFNQCENIKEIFKTNQRLEIIEVVKDYGDINRVIIAKLVGSRS